MQVNIKKLNENAVVPSYAKHGDAGMDLTAITKDFDENGNVVYGTGLAFEIPLGYVGYVFPRSSNAKKDLLLSNSVGVIDSGYRGEVVLKFREVLPIDRDIEFGARDYEIGDRIGQIIIMPIPQIEFNVVNELSETARGNGGFGSTN